MKYKRLSIEELKELEKEFINFLASAQITAQDWEKMKKNEPEKADELIDVFSDVVYNKVLSKIKFVEYRDEKTLNIFNCEEEKITLLGLRVKEQSALKLNDPNIFHQWNENNSNAVNVIRTEKKYIKQREEEIFELLQSGCLITDDSLFKLLNGMVK